MEHLLNLSMSSKVECIEQDNSLSLSLSLVNFAMYIITSLARGGKVLHDWRAIGGN